MLRLRSYGLCLAAGLFSVLLMGGYPSTDCRDYQSGDGGNGGGWPPLPPPTHEYTSWSYEPPPGGWPEPSPYPEAEQAAVSVCESVYPSDSLVARIHSDLDAIRDRYAASYPFVNAGYMVPWNEHWLHVSTDTSGYRLLITAGSEARLALDSLARVYSVNYCSAVKDIYGNHAFLDLALVRAANLFALIGVFAHLPVIDTLTATDRRNQLEPPLCLFQRAAVYNYYFINDCREPLGNSSEDCVYYFSSSGEAVSLLRTINLDEVWNTASRPRWVDTFLTARNHWRAWPRAVLGTDP